jgi:hypothetical protein
MTEENKKVLEEFDEKFISEGYLVYQGNYNLALDKLMNNSTACLDTKADINRIYTEGFNSGLATAKQFLLQTFESKDREWEKFIDNTVKGGVKEFDAGYEKANKEWKEKIKGIVPKIVPYIEAFYVRTLDVENLDKEPSEIIEGMDWQESEKMLIKKLDKIVDKLLKE